MKSNKTITAILVPVVIIAAIATCNSRYPEVQTITILHTNDTHSQIFPIAQDKGRWAGYGGYARRAHLIKEARKADPDILLLDAGDFCQGTPYFNFFKGNIEVDAMGRMGYAGATFGNHEFDNGTASLARLIDRAKFPFISTNYDFTGSEVNGKTLPFKMYDVKGVKVGVFGLTVNTRGMVEAENCKNTQYKDPVAAAQWASDTLRSLGAQVVVALSHLGWKSNPFYLGDDTLAAKTSGIDLIIGGHSHSDCIDTVANKEGMPVLITQAASQGRILGRVDIMLKKE